MINCVSQDRPGRKPCERFLSENVMIVVVFHDVTKDYMLQQFTAYGSMETGR